MGWLNRQGVGRLLSFLLVGLMLLSCEGPQRLVRMPITLVVAHRESGPAGLEMTSFFPNPRPQVQAVGSPHQPVDILATDRDAQLRAATQLRTGAPGVTVLGPALQRNYGTYELVELIQQVGAGFDWQYPGQSLRVGDLSLRKGGTIRDSRGVRVHSSHRNGLDADIMYLREDCHDAGKFDDPSCPLGVEETLDVMRMFIEGGPEDRDTLVDVIYVGNPMQERICKHFQDHPQAKYDYEHVLGHLQIMSGHEVHFHVRIKCPDNSLHCPAVPA